MGFIFCLYLINIDKNTSINIIYLLVIFCLSWAIGLMVPTSPGGLGVFESCFIVFLRDNFPQNIIFVSLIYFRLISTSADILLGLPFLIKKAFR